MLCFVERRPGQFTTDDSGKPQSVDFVEIRGKSTDAKPTKGIANGSSFFEFDTGCLFIFDGETGQWIYPYGGGT